jgi:succinate dehydrogenase cytochrome b subunit
VSSRTKSLPKDFVSRRLHSLLGIWLVLYLIEHLLTNSQAALLFGQDGSGFIRMVNHLESIPFLPVVELLLLGLPFAIHIVWGVKYLLTSKANAHPTDGSTPQLTMYPRNHAYSWQRITAWLLIVGITAHVVQMRFLRHPEEVRVGGTESEYMVRVHLDPSLYATADRMNVKLYDQPMIAERQIAFGRQVGAAKLVLPLERSELMVEPQGTGYSEEAARYYKQVETLLFEQSWLRAAQAKKLAPGEVLAVASQPGVVYLLNLRDVMRNPWMVGLYTILVLMAVYHAFNGLWTASIVWGVTLTVRSQLLWKRICLLLMIVLGFLGLAAVWGTYWMNLHW